MFSIALIIIPLIIGGRAQNINEIIKISQEVSLNLTYNIGDFNALNENYIDRETALNSFSILESEMGTLVPMGFVLQSFASSTLTPTDDIGIMAIQGLISVFDIDTELNMGNSIITIINGTTPLLHLPNGQQGIQCVLNGLFYNGTETLWTMCSPTSSGPIEFGTWNTSWISTTGTAESIITSNFAKDFIRFDIRFKEELNQVNISIIPSVVDIYYKGLNITSLAACKLGYFAYLDMVQQQVLDTIDIKNVESPLLSNILILNEQIIELERQMSFLPNYKSIGAAISVPSLTRSISLGPSAYYACNDVIKGPNLEVHFFKSDENADFPIWCVPEELSECTRQAEFGSLNCVYNDSATETFQVITSIDVGEGPVDFTLNFRLIANIGNMETATVSNNGDVSNGLFVTTGMWQLLFKPQLISTKVFIPTTSANTIRVLNTNIRIPVIISEPFYYNMELINPVPANVEINEQIVYGIEFSINVETYDNFAIEVDSNRYELNYTAIDINCDSRVGESALRFSPKVYVVGAGGKSWWSDCYNINSNPKLPDYSLEGDLNAATNLIWNITVGHTFLNTSNWLIIEHASNPVIIYGTTDTAIQQQLTALANEVTELNERVTKLEDAMGGHLTLLLTFFDTFVNLFDLSLNLADKASYFKLSTSIARRSMHNGDDGKGVATEIASLLKSDRKLSHYDPVEAINQAGIFSYQHGLSKGVWRNNNLKEMELVDITAEIIESNPLDIREMSIMNPTAYLKLQRELGSKAKFGPEFAGGVHGLGEVTALSSPIEQLPVVGKYLHSISKESEGAASFLSNQFQRFPFHTSVATRTFDIEEDGLIVLNSRFAGVAEPSIVGATNAKNPRVKVGYIKFQHEYQEDGTLILRNWDKTVIVPGRTFTEEEVRELYTSFTGITNSQITTDEQWELLSFFTNRRINSRNVIDSIPLPNSIYLDTLDDLVFFDKAGNHFGYSILSNNCQTFVQVFSELATKGYSRLPLSATDFSEFAAAFSARSTSYLHPPYTNQIMDGISYKDITFNKFIKAFN